MQCSHFFELGQWPHTTAETSETSVSVSVSVSVRVGKKKQTRKPSVVCAALIGCRGLLGFDLIGCTIHSREDAKQ